MSDHTDRRQRGFAFLANHLMTDVWPLLDDGERGLLPVLQTYVPTIAVGSSTLAKRLHKQPRAVKRIRSRLVAAGILEVVQDVSGFTRHYRMANFDDAATVARIVASLRQRGSHTGVGEDTGVADDTGVTNGTGVVKDTTGVADDTGTGVANDTPTGVTNDPLIRETEEEKEKRRVEEKMAADAASPPAAAIAPPAASRGPTSSASFSEGSGATSAEGRAEHPTRGIESGRGAEAPSGAATPRDEVRPSEVRPDLSPAAESGAEPRPREDRPDEPARRPKAPAKGKAKAGAGRVKLDDAAKVRICASADAMTRWLKFGTAGLDAPADALASLPPAAGHWHRATPADPSKIDDDASEAQIAAAYWAAAAHVRERLRLPLRLPAMGRLIGSVKSILSTRPRPDAINTLLTIATRWPDIAAALAWMSTPPDLDEAAPSNRQVLAVVARVLAGQPAAAPKPATSYQPIGAWRAEQRPRDEVLATALRNFPELA
jgi:hypothetical protein